MTTMMMLLSGLWNKVWGYVILVVATIGALGAAYFRGRSEMRREVERRVLGQDLENRKQGDLVRGSVDRVDNPDERLRSDWSRPGG